MVIRIAIAFLFLCRADGVMAEQLAFLFDRQGGPPMFEQRAPGDALERQQTASLFSGPNGLFAKPVRSVPAPALARARAPVAQLRDLIARAEAGPKGYDAVQHGARIKTPKPPTAMTVGEVFAWIKATPGQPHAIGRYQFIPSTLRHLVKELGVPKSAQFTPTLQDRLADHLLAQAGLGEFLAGEMGRVPFMNAIARVWAGLPNSSGKSHYHGYAGNKAVISWAAFEAEMVRIFPASG